MKARAALAFVAALGFACAPAVGAPAAPPPPPSAATHPWLTSMNAEVPHVPLDERFAPPVGFTRVPVEPGSFAEFLRTLPIRTDRQVVLDYRSRPLQRPAAAVVYLDVGETDSQQCADTAIRLHAEWRFGRGEAAQSAYHFTSGDRVRFADWVAGERVVAAGRGITRHRGAPRAAGHASFRAWLALVFRYAGTQSLRLDTTAVPEDAALEAGDVFVDPGSPGHAVVLLDVAGAPDGRRVALVGQGYMPAEDLHVLGAGPPATLEGVWFVLPEAGGQLATPSWRAFSRAAARRFGPAKRVNLSPGAVRDTP